MMAVYLKQMTNIWSSLSEQKILPMAKCTGEQQNHPNFWVK